MDQDDTDGYFFLFSLFNYIVLLILYFCGVITIQDSVSEFIFIVAPVLAFFAVFAEVIILSALAAFLFFAAVAYTRIHNPICDMLYLPEYKINL